MDATPPALGMYSEATLPDYLMGTLVTAQSGVTIDPNLPVHPTFCTRASWCLSGLHPAVCYIKKLKFGGDIALPIHDPGMARAASDRSPARTDSLMLVPSIGLRVSQLIAGIAVAAGVAAEIYFTRKAEGKPLMVKLALTADNKAALDKLRKERGRHRPYAGCRH